MVETEGERRAGSVPKFGDPVSIDTTCTENEAKLLTATATSSTDVTSINDNNNNKVLKENDDETPKTFPQILMEILTSDDHADTISWLPHGRSFIIHKKKSFGSTVLPKYFKATKFTSFTRKLNRWGFTRVTRGPEMGSYYHRQFLRDSPELCLRMSSHTSSKYKYREPTNTHQVQPHLMTAVGPGGVAFPFYGMAQAVMPPGVTTSNIAPIPAELSQQNQYINQQLQQLQWRQYQLQQFQQQQLQVAQQATTPANTGGSAPGVNANANGRDKSTTPNVNASNDDEPQQQQSLVPHPSGGPYPSEQSQQQLTSITPPHSIAHHSHPHQHQHLSVAPYYTHHPHHQYGQQQHPSLQPHPSSRGGLESGERHTHTGQQHPSAQTQPRDYQQQYPTQHHPYIHNVQHDQQQHPGGVHHVPTHPHHAIAQQESGEPPGPSQLALASTPTSTRGR